MYLLSAAKTRVKMREVQFSATLGRLDRNPSSFIVFALAWLMDKKGKKKTSLGEEHCLQCPLLSEFPDSRAGYVYSPAKGTFFSSASAILDFEHPGCFIQKT